jgi:hypothetical protein
MITKTSLAMKRLLLFIFTAIVSAGLFAQLSSEESQLLYLSFDDDTELSANEQDIDLLDEADVEGAEGMFGGAISFNGSTSYLVMKTIPDWNHGMDWSLSLWFQTAFSGGQGMVGITTFSGSIEEDDWDSPELQAGFGMFFVSDDMLMADCSWVNALEPEGDFDFYNDGEWHLVVVTYAAEATTLKMYVDGALYAESADFNIAEVVEELGVSIDDDNLKIGFTSGTFPEEVASMVFDGLMDDLRLFNVTLTAEEVTEIFEYEPTGARDFTAIDQLSVYPNPAGDFIQLNTESHNVWIYNSVGSLVESIENYNGGRISVGHLSNGMYMIKTNNSTVKVIIQ